MSALRNPHAAPGNRLFARSLVVIQFALALLLITGCLVINLQSRFLQGKDLGYNEENLLKVSLPVNMDGGGISLKNELRQHIRFGSAALGALRTNSGLEMEAGTGRLLSYSMAVDENFLETAEIRLKAGRNFDSREHHSNVLVNEAFVQKFDIDRPVGRKISSSQDSEFTIIGVVNDFQAGALDRMSPLILFKAGSAWGDGSDLFLRLPPGDISKDLSEFAAIFRKHFPYYPFDAQFQADINLRSYRAALRWQRIVNYSCAMAIFIACFGLLGLSLLSAQSRTKEIGIRKVLGASVSGIVALLSGNFIKPVLLAIILATPLAWYIMGQWLEDFAYRISLQWWMFALAGLLALIIALFTVCFQSIKAALANPADSLRNE
ncbi:MacB-like protein [Anseongella ginsenosidimutans]|uniref:MacB-like protein n=1 Tax=Anseongella ginsenosidimutans TaxID=496056 RepID=A0A4V2UUE0_9SPHI|nr:FtsX-like permease family protein [Anseongella ginsenosidimutans]QEC50995.1 FtsX-like permease family protein [Anseongella ginsenosidimutans]TCS90353.1 MacB-like protein [Anseongella ginsenosidimutans]